MRSYLVEQGIEDIWYLTDEGSASTSKTDGESTGEKEAVGKVWAKRFEGDWAGDEFWKGLDK